MVLISSENRLGLQASSFPSVVASSLLGQETTVSADDNTGL